MQECVQLGMGWFQRWTLSHLGFSSQGVQWVHYLHCIMSIRYIHYIHGQSSWNDDIILSLCWAKLGSFVCHHITALWKTSSVTYLCLSTSALLLPLLFSSSFFVAFSEGRWVFEGEGSFSHHSPSDWQLNLIHRFHLLCFYKHRGW